MSFILDALKKSEAERQRKDPPGIANIPESGRQKSSTKWIWVVLALVTLNLVVLAVLMIKVEQDSTPTAETNPVADTATRITPVVTPSAATASIRRDEPPVSSDAMETVLEESAATPAGIPPAPTDSVIEVQSGTVSNDIETFNDLRAKGVFMLPDMHLDIHVYSGNPADRFVFVNMSKYKENATLTEGPVVSEITPDGVILRYQGTAFLLPRE